MKLQKIKKKGQVPAAPGTRITARANAGERGYNHRWRVARVAFLREHPFCVHCLPLYVAATVVDHIVPHRGDQQLFWDKSNWQPLCKVCHDQWKQKIENEMLQLDRGLW